MEVLKPMVFNRGFERLSWGLKNLREHIPQG